MGLNDNAILKQVNVITETQDDPSELTSRTGGIQDDSPTFTSRTRDSKKSSNVTPDRVHRNNLVTSSPLQKYSIHYKEGTEPHESKPH